MEKVNLKIDLNIITHDQVGEHPFVNISVNGFPQFGEILDKSKRVEIDIEIEENTNNFLTIEYLNKDPKKDVVLGDDGEPILDKRVEINAIIIDDIYLDFWAFDNEDTLSYQSIEDESKSATGFEATKLSWNGRTTFKFTTPVYLWILENI